MTPEQAQREILMFLSTDHIIRLLTLINKPASLEDCHIDIFPRIINARKTIYIFLTAEYSLYRSLTCLEDAAKIEGRPRYTAQQTYTGPLSPINCDRQQKCVSSVIRNLIVHASHSRPILDALVGKR